MQPDVLLLLDFKHLLMLQEQHKLHELLLK